MARQWTASNRLFRIVANRIVEFGVYGCHSHHHDLQHIDVGSSHSGVVGYGADSYVTLRISPSLPFGRYGLMLRVTNEGTYREVPVKNIVCSSLFCKPSVGNWDGSCLYYDYSGPIDVDLCNWVLCTYYCVVWFVLVY